MTLLSSEVPALAREHAAALLTSLLETHAGREILARDVASMYLQLCKARDWKPVRWHNRHGVAHALNTALGGQKKQYRSVATDVPGSKRRRWMIFSIPAQHQSTEDK